jgi:hypothetical protein
LLHHLLRIYYEEENKINRKAPNSPTVNAIDDDEDEDEDEDSDDDSDNESHPQKSTKNILAILIKA